MYDFQKAFFLRDNHLGRIGGLSEQRQGREK
jgi:hypothetical protein